MARQAALDLIARIDPDGANSTWLDAREASTGQLIGAVGAASFFGASRVLVVTNLLNRPTRDSRGAHTGAKSAGGSDVALAALLAAVPEQNCLILLEPDLETPPAAIRSATPPISIIAGEPPRGAALVAWIEETARRAEARIDRRTAQFLAETLFPQTWDRKPANPRFDRPPDLASLTQEIEKLALAAYPDPIARDHVLALIPGGPDQRVFRFIDAAVGGDLRSAIGELERLTVAGEEPAMVLAQLLGQAELVAVASAASGRDANTIARDLGAVTPARMSAIVNSAQRQRLPVDESLTEGATIDRNLKTGRIRRPDEALHQLLLAMTAPESSRGTGRSR